MSRSLPPPPERRAFGRRETLIHAIVRVAGRPPEPCIVRNVSDHGALIELPVGVEPPDRFRLQIEAKGVDVLCQPRRRDGNLIGVEFCAEGVETATFNPLPSFTSDHPAPAAARSSAVAPAQLASAPPSLAPSPIISAITGDEVRRQLGLVAG